MQNAETTRELIEALGISPAAAGQIKDPIPVVECNPRAIRPCSLIKSATKTITGTLTLYTSNASEDCYISTITAGYSKDAACDGAIGNAVINATINGSAQLIHTFWQILAVAQTDTIVINFPHPIKLDPGQAIWMTGTFGAGVMNRSISIFGWTEKRVY
jgi:hypothetical protein